MFAINYIGRKCMCINYSMHNVISLRVLHSCFQAIRAGAAGSLEHKLAGSLTKEVNLSEHIMQTVNTINTWNLAK